jgi:hypothetical protein
VICAVLRASSCFGRVDPEPQAATICGRVEGKAVADCGEVSLHFTPDVMAGENRLCPIGQQPADQAVLFVETIPPPR